MTLKTRYPLLTACVPHKINAYLEKSGAELYAVGLDAQAPPEKNALLLKSKIESVCERTGAEKVNIISFDLAGLAARAVVHMDGAEKLASITTVCTPHRGMRTADKLAGARVKRLSPAYLAYRNLAERLNDRSPQLHESICRLTTEDMRAFNLLHPDVEGIFRQSAACAMKPEDDRGLAGANNILAMYDGENDGFVSVYSAMWGQYCRIYRGISHMSVPPEVYADMVQSLIARGL